MTPESLEARAKREEDTYGQKELPAMLRAGAEAMREVDRLRAALRNIDALDPEGMVNGCSPDALRGLVSRMGEIARAALMPAVPTDYERKIAQLKEDFPNGI